MVQVIPEKRFYTSKGKYVILSPKIKLYSAKELKMLEAYRKSQSGTRKQAERFMQTVGAGAGEIARKGRNAGESAVRIARSEGTKKAAKGFLHELNQAFK